MNSHDVKAVVEVGTEASFLNGTLQIAVGGGYDSNINRNRRDSSHPLEFPFLQKPQELGLELLGNIADLIKKIVPPWASSILPVLRRWAPVKEPCSWPNSSLSKSSFDSPTELIAIKGLSFLSLQL